MPLLSLWLQCARSCPATRNCRLIRRDEVTGRLGVTAAPLDCLSSEIKLVGSFNDCTSIDSASSNCQVSPPVFNTLFKLFGRSQDFLLYLMVPGGYSGAGEQ